MRYFFLAGHALKLADLFGSRLHLIWQTANSSSFLDILPFFWSSSDQVAVISRTGKYSDFVVCKSLYSHVSYKYITMIPSGRFLMCCQNSKRTSPRVLLALSIRLWYIFIGRLAIKYINDPINSSFIIYGSICTSLINVISFMPQETELFIPTNWHLANHPQQWKEIHVPSAWYQSLYSDPPWMRPWTTEKKMTG